jgi:S1-C subfamily serine protease
MENVTPDTVPVIRKHRLRDGEAAVALGYPLAQPFSVTAGVISSTAGESGAVWTTCPISSGNSGGPLFLQRGGLLAGLNTFARGREGAIAQNLNGAEPAEELVGPLQAGRTEKWIWAPDLKDIVTELVKLVPLRD